MNVKLVFEDWRQHGNPKSVYSTPLGLELSSGDLHSGTTFRANVSLPQGVEEEINKAAFEHGAYPVFAVISEKSKDAAGEPSVTKLSEKEAMQEKLSIDKDWRIHEDAIAVLRQRLKNLQSKRCPHKAGHYNHDPAGGSDSWTECSICGGEM